jgi:hypothetical protein
MSPPDGNTGTPPAITYEQWREIAAAVKTALDIGGETGMDLLIGRMAEWTEAVDEWNASLYTCWQLASRGLRDEAKQWHAEGFFEVGERLLEPFDRDGWAAWKEALDAREVSVPQFDRELRGMVGAMFEELSSQSVSGHWLKDQLDAFRRNVLLRGDLGTRLTLLTSIRNIDPGRGIWTDMIAPIRRQRAGQIEAEVRAAIETRNFTKLARLIEEVKAVDWEGQLSGPLAALTKAVPHLFTCRDGIHSLEEAASLLAVRCRDLSHIQNVYSPSFPVMLNAAIQAKGHFLSLRKDFVQALQLANSVPETSAVAIEMKFLEQAKAVEKSAKQSLAWLAQQEQFEEGRAAFGKKEDDIQKLIEKAPESAVGWEEFKQRSAEWLRRESDLRIATKRLCERSPGLVPTSTNARLAELEACRNLVKASRDRIVYKEKIAIAAVVGLLLVFILFVVGVFFISAVRRSGA